MQKAFYTIKEQKNTDVTLSPLQCPKCKKLDVDYSQYTQVASCPHCGYTS